MQLHRVGHTLVSGASSPLPGCGPARPKAGAGPGTGPEQGRSGDRPGAGCAGSLGPAVSHAGGERTALGPLTEWRGFRSSLGAWSSLLWEAAGGPAPACSPRTWPPPVPVAAFISAAQRRIWRPIISQLSGTGDHRSPAENLGLTPPKPGEGSCRPAAGVSGPRRRRCTSERGWGPRPWF